eukprot:1708837-Lingulodinium_polyedra.AAC.1
MEMRGHGCSRPGLLRGPDQRRTTRPRTFIRSSGAKLSSRTPSTGTCQRPLKQDTCPVPPGC